MLVQFPFYVYVVVLSLQYDHLEFPGVVPRTFLGPILISFMSAPSVVVWNLLGLPKPAVQVLVRLGLAVAVWLGFRRFVLSVNSRFGTMCAKFLVAIVTTQFHFVFYSSRTLPNTFAVTAVLFGVSFWMDRQWRLAVLAFSMAVVWWRCDMLILVGPLILSMLLSGSASFLSLIK